MIRGGTLQGDVPSFHPTVEDEGKNHYHIETVLDAGLELSLIDGVILYFSFIEYQFVHYFTIDF